MLFNTITMIDSLKALFGFGPTIDYKLLKEQGAFILDVRSKGEYSAGHIKGSVNIPVDTLSQNLSKLKDKNRPIITCCASGMRSVTAKSILKANGYTIVHNGGGWSRLERKLEDRRD